MRVGVALLALCVQACAMSNSFAVRIGKPDKSLTACKGAEPEDPTDPPAPKRVSKKAVKSPKAVCASED
jgi:hypothetical protein